MNIAGFTHLTLLDYPSKIAAIIFTSGCNLSCPFCHNSSLITEKNSLISEETILDYLTKYYGKLDAVCISGGEPTLQKDLISFLKKIKKIGYLIKLDTNGTNPVILEKLLKEKLIDYIAMDIKNTPLKYAQTSGKKVNIDNLNKSITLIQNSQIDHEFRTTIIKEYHTIEDIKTIAKWINNSKYYLQSFKLSNDVQDKTLHEPTLNDMQEYLKEARKINPQTMLRGL